MEQHIHGKMKADEDDEEELHTMDETILQSIQVII
jgi:hypothetical protein